MARRGGWRALRALDRLRTGAVRPGFSYLAFIIPPVVSAKGGRRPGVLEGG